MSSANAHHRRNDRARRLGAAALAAALALSAGCEHTTCDPTQKVGDPRGHIIDGDRSFEGRTYAADTAGIDLGTTSDVPTAKDSIKAGTGEFVRTVAPPPKDADTSPGDVTLNFDGTDIREVAKVILGDLLGVNYILDPAVQGSASLQTGRPLRREHLIPTLETLLRMNNAALVYREGAYQVVPVANAVQGKVVPQLGESDRPLPGGYSVQVVPLQYIGAEEMSKILEPLAPEGSIIRVDSLRNLLLIAGTGPQLGNLLDTVRVFDVDWMAGLSVGFFTLEYASAGEVVQQLEGLLADESGNPFKGLFRFIPVESANSLLVISPRESYLRQVKDWIERLDLAEASGEASERLFVYRVKHGDATNLADILTQLFAADQEAARRVGSLAPGLRPATIQSRQSDGLGGGLGGSGLGRDRSSLSRDRSSLGGSTLGGSTLGGDRDGIGGSSSFGQQSGGARQAVSSTLELSSLVSIVADPINNSLLIKASARDYKKILDALKQLDLVPLQVLVEATIIEIRLTGNLEYGVQWQFFGGKADQRFDFSLDGTLDSETTAGIGKIFPGFNWAVVVPPDAIRATLSALAADGLVNVLSSPSVMVLDNQTAKIQVGQQVPVATTQQQGLNVGDRVVNTIEYRDTGVQLSVKPRVTPGGLVQMEIEQEVSTVAATSSSALNSPTFQTRNITSAVAVRSNQAVVLGGLIEDVRQDGKQGIPGLYDIPVVGALFGERTKQANRTELVVVLIPRVISSDQDVENVTTSFRRKLKGLGTSF